MEIDREITEIENSIINKQRAIDRVNEDSRALIRMSGQIITMIHNGEDVKDRIAEAKALLDRLEPEREFRYYSIQAMQEYSEAVIFYEICRGRGILGYRDVGVEPDAYLLGLMDVVGELRREVTESLSKNDIDSAERYYSMIKRLFDLTRGMRYSDSVLPGFRRKQDVARIQMENSGSEILVSKKRIG